MTTPVKLTAAAAVLAMVFGTAAVAGGAVGQIHNPTRASSSSATASTYAASTSSPKEIAQ
jgi:hypothetical protein